MPVLTCLKCGSRYRIDKPGRYGCTKCGAALPPLAEETGANARPGLPRPGNVAQGAPPSRPGAAAAPAEDPEVAALERQIAADASLREPYLRLAQHHIDCGRKSEAIATYRRLLAWIPDDAFALKRLAGLEASKASTDAGTAGATAGAAAGAAGGSGGAAIDPSAPRQAHLDIPAPDTSAIEDAKRHARKARMVIAAGALGVLVASLLWLFRGSLWPAETPLVSEPRNGHGPLWSPDGRRLAFHQWSDSGSTLCVLDVESKTVRELAASKEKDWPPDAYRWSPDGLDLAFSVPRDDRGRSRPGVFTVSASGGDPRFIAWGTGPTWSHDGRHVVMTCTPTDPDWGRNLSQQNWVCAINVATGDATRISERGGRHPAPDPRSARVAYELALPPTGSDREMEVWERAEAAKSMTEEQVHKRFEDIEKGPDGRFLHIEARDIWLVGLDGSGPVAVTTDGRSASPGWWPDGSRLLYMQYAPGQSRPELWLMGADGSERERLLPSEGVFANDPDEVGIRAARSEVVYRVLLQNVDAGFVGIVVGNVITADLFVVGRGAAQPRRLENRHTFKGPFSLSPDGRRVAYEWIDKDTANTEIWLTDVGN